jgi:hypothetical protein
MTLKSRSTRDESEVVGVAAVGLDFEGIGALADAEELEDVLEVVVGHLGVAGVEKPPVFRVGADGSGVVAEFFRGVGLGIDGDAGNVEVGIIAKFVINFPEFFTVADGAVGADGKKLGGDPDLAAEVGEFDGLVVLGGGGEVFGDFKPLGSDVFAGVYGGGGGLVGIVQAGGEPHGESDDAGGKEEDSGVKEGDGGAALHQGLKGSVRSLSMVRVRRSSSSAALLRSVPVFAPRASQAWALLEVEGGDEGRAALLLGNDGATDVAVLVEEDDGGVVFPFPVGFVGVNGGFEFIFDELMEGFRFHCCRATRGGVRCRGPWLVV